MVHGACLDASGACGLLDPVDISDCNLYFFVGKRNDRVISKMALSEHEPTLLNTSDFVFQDHQVPEGGVHNPDVRHHGVLRLHSSLSNR